jgi:hypothetical protein
LIVRRALASAFGAALFAACAAAAFAKPTYDVSGRSLAFFADLLGIVARGEPAVVLRDGLALRGDAAYIDLVHNRILFAGNARATRGAATLSGDAIAVDLDKAAVDVLDADGGARQTALDLRDPKTTPIDSDRFAFPDVDEKYAYIRAHRAEVTAHVNARFAPAAFPNSPGALPVPSYLYTYDANPSFGANSLGGATFDQPYGIIGGPTSLLAAHARYEQNVGITAALDEHLVYGDNAYILASIDSPQSATRNGALDVYERMGPHFSQTLTAAAGPYGDDASYTLTGAFGHASSRLTIAQSGEFGSVDWSARTPDRPLIGGAIYHFTGDFGFTAYPGGDISVIPDRAKFATVWQHGLGLIASTPIVHAPFKTSLWSTVNAQREWYSFPHQHDTGSLTSTLSRAFSRALDVNVSYTAAFTLDHYGPLQGLFYPPPPAHFTAPDGTPWPGFAAFSGASEARGVTVDTSYSPNGFTSIRLTYTHTDDFPQFHGYGRPLDELSYDARLRPLPNIGVDVARSYYFGWGGQRFSQWTLSILP